MPYRTMPRYALHFIDIPQARFVSQERKALESSNLVNRFWRQLDKPALPFLDQQDKV